MHRIFFTLATFMLTSIVVQAQDLAVYNADIIDCGPNR